MSKCRQIFEQSPLKWVFAEKLCWQNVVKFGCFVGKMSANVGTLKLTLSILALLFHLFLQSHLVIALIDELYNSLRNEHFVK